MAASGWQFGIAFAAKDGGVMCLAPDRRRWLLYEQSAGEDELPVGAPRCGTALPDDKVVVVEVDCGREGIEYYGFCGRHLGDSVKSIQSKGGWPMRVMESPGGWSCMECGEETIKRIRKVE